MRITLIRHGQTPGNALRRYIGRTDEPLSEEGVAAAKGAGSDPKAQFVFVTPLLRTQQTAALLFPNARQEVLPSLREMDFGAFENRSADEMAEDAGYRAWVDGWCLGACPGGESMATFCERVCAGFAETVQRLAREGAQEAVFVAHGGSIRAILSRFGRPQKGFYDYQVPNCGGCRCTLAPGEEGMSFVLTEISSI